MLLPKQILHGKLTHRWPKLSCACPTFDLCWVQWPLYAMTLLILCRSSIVGIKFIKTSRNKKACRHLVWIWTTKWFHFLKPQMKLMKWNAIFLESSMCTKAFKWTLLKPFQIPLLAMNTVNAKLRSLPIRKEYHSCVCKTSLSTVSALQ